MKTWNFYTARQIRPEGWIKQQLQLQARGLCGNLDKVWPDVRDSAWIGGKREGWERVPYWLDGFIPLAYLLEDGDMIARARKYIDAIVAAQQPDGWICPCKQEERAAYDTWAVQLISKVLTVYYECSGDERIPAVVHGVMKNYYDLLRSGQIRLFDWGKFRWFETFIAIDFLYSRSPEPWLKELGQILKDQGADYRTFTESWKRPLNFWQWHTHIVNIAMMLKYEAVSCELLGEEYADQIRPLHDILERYNGTPVGGFTGDECLAGLSPIHGTELCAVVEQMYSYEWLFAVTGDPFWAERLELLAFNALPATVSDDMWSHQYDQLSNQIACQKFPGKSFFRTNSSESHLFGLEPNYGCCTANFGQGWPKLALFAWLHRDQTIISALPVPSRLRTAGKSIRLETEYPFGTAFRYTVDCETAFTLQIRIPSFAKNVRLDGGAAEGEILSIDICPGHREIRVEFDAEPVLEERPHGLHTVRWGSLVFSVPISTETKMLEYERDGVERKFPYCDYELIPTSDWNYAWCGRELTVEKRSGDGVPFSSAAPRVTVRTKVQKIPWGLEDGYDTLCAKVPETAKPIGQPEQIALYPYGCAKLRMTELPLVEESRGQNGNATNMSF